MKRTALLVCAAALACAGGSGHVVLDLEHRAVVSDEPLPAGVARLIYAVTLTDDRGEDDANYICDVGRQVLSQRPVREIVKDAVEAELRVRDLRVAPTPAEADVVLHLELHEFMCSVGAGLRGKVQAEVGLRLMPGEREAYWTTVTEESFGAPAATRREKPEQLLLKTMERTLAEFAKRVATNPDLMIEIQRLQARGELPD